MKISKDRQKKATGVIVGVIALIGVIYYFGFQGVRAKIKQERASQARLSEEIRKFQKSKLQLLEDKNLAIRCREQLTEFEKQIPSKPVDTWTLDQVDHVAQPLGIYFKSSVVLSEPELSAINLQDGAYEIHFLNVTFVDELSKIGAFVADMENRFPTMILDKMTIVAGGGGDAHLHQVQLRAGFLHKK